MSERLCGYCRQPNHRKPDCPDFNEQRKLVLTHTPKQRKILIESLAKVGLGNGALLRVKDYWNPENFHLVIVRDFNWVQSCNFTDPKNIKYSKRVRILPLEVERDFEGRSINASVVQLSGGAQENRIRVPITRLLKRQVNPDYRNEEEFFNPINFTIDSPSYDIDYDPSILIKEVGIPQRLAITTNEKTFGFTTGYMPVTIT